MSDANLSGSRNSNQDQDGYHSAEGSNNGYTGNQGKGVTFQDQEIVVMNTGNTSNNNEASDHPPEEVDDIVHDLDDGIAITMAHSGLMVGEAIETSPVERKKRSLSGKNLVGKGKNIRVEDIEQTMPVMQTVQDMSAFEGSQTVSVTPYSVNMEASVYEFSNHVQECNINFRENVFQKLQTIKLKDTDQLNIKIEELKVQEAHELSQLNRGYIEVEMRVKKLERKVSAVVDSETVERKIRQGY